MVLVTHGTQDNSSEEAAIIKSIEHKSNSTLEEAENEEENSDEGSK